MLEQGTQGTRTVAVVGPRVTGPARGTRGRPRSERCRAAVLEAAADLLTGGGLEAVTMEAIAARAKVSKATVYKWWPTRAHVMLESFFNRSRETTDLPGGLSLEESLTTLVAALARLLRDTTAGALMADLIAAAQHDPDIRAVLDERWVRPRRAVSEDLLRAAVDRGELAADTDVAAAVDQLYAPVYYRLLLGHGPLTDELAATLVRQSLAGLRPRRPA